MRRETRINFWFLVVFVAVSLPGAVILFRKKLDPTAHRLDQPDPVLNRLPYMVPPPAPPGVRWVVPDLTQRWVAELAGPGGPLSAAPPGPQWEPVISGDHLLQVLRADREADSMRLSLLVWDGGIEPRAAAFTVTVDGGGGGGGDAGAKVQSAERVALPHDVRRELVVMGFVRPPEQVVRVDMTCGTLAPGAAHRVELSYHGPPAPLHASVEFPVR